MIKKLKPIDKTLFGDDVRNDILLPVRPEVCWNCRGNGTTVNPSIDGNGLSCSEMHEDPDFIDAYMSGVYDVKCIECDGLKVVEIVDEGAMNQETADLWQAQCDQEYRDSLEY